METYKRLIGRVIESGCNDRVVNSCLINCLKPTDEFDDDRGRIYIGEVDWKHSNLPNSYSVVDFDEKTIDELISSGISFYSTSNSQTYFYRLPDWELE